MDLNNNNEQTTVIIDVSFSEDIDIVKEFVLNEQCPFVNSQADEGLIKFEWFLDESNKTGTLIEVFANPVAWEDLANKVIGTPVNVKFGEIFNIESMTVLGEVTDALKEKIKAMNPTIKNYIGGIN